MMLRIIKNKTYKGMKDQIDRLTKQILKQQNENSQLKNEKLALARHIESQQNEIHRQTFEIKRLKTLLTKNKISYVKEEKEVSKCKKTK